MPTRRCKHDKHALLVLAMLAASCARANDDAVHEPTDEELGVTTTDAIGPERMEGDLPALPLSLGTASENFQRLYEGIEQALSDPMPEPDVSSEAAYRRYVDDELTEWLGRRSEELAEAVTYLRALRGGTDVEWIVGNALVAFLYESTASDVIDAPVPGERRRPERAALLRDAWREQLTPLLEHAAEMYGTCIEAGRAGPIETQHWVEVCTAHDAALGPALREESDGAAAQDAP